MKVTKRTLAAFFLILFSVCIIGYKFAHIPVSLSFDEVEFAKLALSLQDTHFILYSPQATGHTTLYFYILLISLKLFGISTLALRLPSALFGIGSVVVFYALMKKVFKKIEIVFFSTFAFLSLHWFITFSRFSFEATFLLFLELISLYSFVVFLEKKDIRFLVFSSIFAGLAFHSYTPGRLFFLVPLIVLILKKQIRQLMIFLIPFLILALPLVFYLIFNPDLRVSQLSILTNPSLSATQKLLSIADNSVRTTLMFVFHGDMNGRHNYPGKAALNPIIGLLFIGGIAEIIRRYKKYPYSFMFIVYCAVSIIPTLFTPPSENPNMLRTFTAIPAVVYLIGVAIAYILERFKRQKNVVIALISIALILSTLYELRTYFVFQSRVSRNAFGITCPLDEVIGYNTERVENIPKSCRILDYSF